jgi:nucleoside diphosphate-linked moiety X motif protein 19
MTQPATPKDAATILLLAPADDDAKQATSCAYEIFMVKRHAKSGFMAGAYVFPGGVADDADKGPIWADLREKYANRFSDHEIQLRITAIRETFEEAGVLLVQPHGSSAALNPEERVQWREKIHEDAAQLHALCAQLGATPDLDALIPWARWITPKYEGRRYDARFFVTVLNELPDATHDNLETVSSAWLTPQHALSLWDDGSIFLPPPTWYTLLELAQATELNEIEEVPRDVTPIEPHLMFENQNIILALPGDHQHPDTTQASGEAKNRITLHGTSLSQVQEYILERTEN